MLPPAPYIWNKAPAIRLLVPLIPGIVLQWYHPLPIQLILRIGAACVFLLLSSYLLSIVQKFRWRPVQGIFLNLLVMALGMFLVNARDIRNHDGWFGKCYAPGDPLLVRLEEPLVDKPNSFKAVASVLSVVKKEISYQTRGQLIVYFKKENFTGRLGYGSVLLISKPIQEIKNSGNPAAFDYKRYSLFRGITHQVFVSKAEVIQLPTTNSSNPRQFLFQCRAAILSVLKKSIAGEKERGLAEALLIGYKDNLDKLLVQAYANTGVVHVIAISGLHLGLIYGILLLLTRPLARLRLLRAFIILCNLWLFSLLVGAPASVLRSAVMFSAIALSVVLDRRSSIYNTMALSAFLLLCYQPFWLWDLGFQLSYTAVLSILIFFRPVYNMMYFSNKAMDAVWKLSAVTLAAQLLTTPLTLFHFHQFPVLFLVTNLVAVPLSTIILAGAILLCCLFFIKPVATTLGAILESLIRWMNAFIEHIEQTGFALWEGINISLAQTLILYLILVAFAIAWLDKKKIMLQWGVVCCIALLLLRSYALVELMDQKKIIVYNVPRHAAIDIMEGRNYFFLGDAALLENQELVRFHLSPSRVQRRVRYAGYRQNKCFRFHGKTIMILQHALPTHTAVPVAIDVLILSGNLKINIENLQHVLSISQVVIDSSVPFYKAKDFQQQCMQSNIPCFSVADNGAFVMSL